MSNDLLSKNYQAGADTVRYRFAKPGTADGQAVLADAPIAPVIGVFGELSQTSGGRVDVIRIGLADIEYGGTVTRGDELVSDAVGRAVSVSSDVSAITKANPGAVTTAAAHGYATGDQVRFSGVGGMTQLNGQAYTITVTGATSFTLGVDTTTFGTFTSGGRANKVNDAAGVMRTNGRAEVSGVAGDIGAVLLRG